MEDQTVETTSQVVAVQEDGTEIHGWPDAIVGEMPPPTVDPEVPLDEPEHATVEEPVVVEQVVHTHEHRSFASGMRPTIITGINK